MLLNSPENMKSPPNFKPMTVKQTLPLLFQGEQGQNPKRKALIAGFTIVKDKTSPQATYMINGDTNLKNKYKDNVELKFETEEDVILFMNGQAQTGYQKAGSVTLTENGEYDVYVLDRAGNKGTEISFAIAKDDPAMTVTKGRQNNRRWRCRCFGHSPIPSKTGDSN